MTANSAMILLYWDIGCIILGRQQHSGWGAKITDQTDTQNCIFNWKHSR